MICGRNIQPHIRKSIRTAKGAFFRNDGGIPGKELKLFQPKRITPLAGNGEELVELFAMCKVESIAFDPLEMLLGSTITGERLYSVSAFRRVDHRFLIQSS